MSATNFVRTPLQVLNNMADLLLNPRNPFDDLIYELSHNPNVRADTIQYVLSLRKVPQADIDKVVAAYQQAR